MHSILNSFLDRIYRINWIFLLISHFPEENEETQIDCAFKKRASADKQESDEGNK